MLQLLVLALALFITMPVVSAWAPKDVHACTAMRRDDSQTVCKECRHMGRETRKRKSHEHQASCCFAIAPTLLPKQISRCRQRAESIMQSRRRLHLRGSSWDCFWGRRPGLMHAPQLHSGIIPACGNAVGVCCTPRYSCHFSLMAL